MWSHQVKLLGAILADMVVICSSLPGELLDNHTSVVGWFSTHQQLPQVLFVSSILILSLTTGHNLAQSERSLEGECYGQYKRCVLSTPVCKLQYVFVVEQFILVYTAHFN